MRLPMALLLAGLSTSALAQAPQPSQPPSRDILHVQVILDHLGFGPGVIDGKSGQSLEAAISGFQEQRGLPVTGKPDLKTLQALYPYRQWRPTARVTLTPAMLAGPFYQIPKGLDQQAKLPALGYQNVMEKLGEMFHTTPETLVALNGPGTKLAPGVKIVVPDVLPQARAYDPSLKPEWRATLDMLNIDSNQPSGAKVVVSKSKGVLRVIDAQGKLVAQFSATMGSSHDPLPIGSWKILGADYNPKFHYNPKLFWDAKKSDDPAMLPAGPNGPVGVVWLDLSKPHYGIHGTPEPRYIGRTESHGCIRLTNWDAARLSMMVKPGTPAIFEN